MNAYGILTACSAVAMAAFLAVMGVACLLIVPSSYYSETASQIALVISLIVAIIFAIRAWKWAFEQTQKKFDDTVEHLNRLSKEPLPKK